MAGRSVQVGAPAGEARLQRAAASRDAARCNGGCKPAHDRQRLRGRRRRQIRRYARYFPARILDSVAAEMAEMHQAAMHAFCDPRYLSAPSC